MGIFDKLKEMVGTARAKLPEDLNSVDEIKAKAQQLAGDHGEQINKTVDGVQEKFAGNNEAVNKRIDDAQAKLDGFAQDQKK